MPTKRAKKTRTIKLDIHPVHLDMLYDKPVGKSFAAIQGPSKEDWNAHKAEILSYWIRKHPGTRPSYWWQFEAPEPRRRLGGVGQAAHEVLNYVESYAYGLPTLWVDNEYIGEPEQGLQPIDPGDPPRFESQAAYLARHGLLTEEEKRLLAESAYTAIEVKGA